MTGGLFPPGCTSFVAGLGLPPIPLIPVSSSQAVVGAVIGIAFLQGLKGVRQVKWGVLGGIASGWVTTPVIAALISFISLFIVQNVFAQQVYQTATSSVFQTLAEMEIVTEQLSDFEGEKIAKAVDFREKLQQDIQLSTKKEN